MYLFLKNELHFSVKEFTNIPHYFGTENLTVPLENDNDTYHSFLNNTKPGDVVLYSYTGSYWDHAAMVVDWGDQTFYNEPWESPGSPLDWKSIFDCGEFTEKPLVVERNGAINYEASGARAIDNTRSVIVKMAIFYVW